MSNALSSKNRVENVIPILDVASVAASIDYYTGRLGFSVDWRVDGFASVSRDGCAIYLSEDGQGHRGTSLWMGVEDVEQLLAEFRSKGAQIIQEPRNRTWALEMRVADPDGHVLRVGSEPKSDRPIYDRP
jgi:catechol 2,3-dioxygenase-like lactoylglutathione lyase family enzyme